MLQNRYYKPLLISLIVLIGFALFFIFPPKSMNLRLNKIVLMDGAVAVAVILAFIKNPWLKVFMLWVLIRLYLTFTSNALSTCVSVFLFIMFYQAIKDKLPVHYFNLVLNSICVLSIINAFMMIAQCFNWWLVIFPKGFNTFNAIYFNGALVNLQRTFAEYRYYITGFFGNTGDTSAFIALTFPAFFRKGWYWFIPLILASIFLAGMLAGEFAVGVIIAYFIYTKAPRYKIYLISIWSLLCIWIASLVTNFETVVTFGGRTYVWDEIYHNLIVKHPLIGVGLGNFQDVWPPIHKAINGHYSYQRWTFAHNDYIQTLAELGIIGMTIVGGFIINTLIKGRRVTRHSNRIFFAGILTAFLLAIVNFSFHLTSVVLFVTYLAMFEKGGSNEKVVA